MTRALLLGAAIALLGATSAPTPTPSPAPTATPRPLSAGVDLDLRNVFADPALQLIVHCDWISTSMRVEHNLSPRAVLICEK